MGGRGGLIELALALSFIAAWGVVEWRCRQLDRKRDEARKPRDEAPKD